MNQGWWWAAYRGGILARRASEGNACRTGQRQFPRSRVGLVETGFGLVVEGVLRKSRGCKFASAVLVMGCEMRGVDYRNEYVNIACFSSLTRRVT